LFEGAAMARIDSEELQAVYLFNQRYVENAKKPKMKKIFDRSKLERSVRNIFEPSKDERKSERRRLYDRVRKAFS